MAEVQARSLIPVVFVSRITKIDTKGNNYENKRSQNQFTDFLR